MNKLFKILLFSFLFTIFSCGENETKVYKGNYNDFTFLSIDAAYKLEVVKDGTGTLIIPFGASAVSPNDRTYSIELVVPEDQDAVVADPNSYDLPSSVTIPANQFIGNIVITGNDDLNLVDSDPKSFTFRILGLNDKEFMDYSEITVEVVEVCPLAEGIKYTGDYMLETVIPGAFGASFQSGIVTLEYVSEFTRRFSGTYLPEQGGFAGREFNFSLMCGFVIANPVNTFVGCGEPRIFLGPADNPSQYNPNDDSELIITFKEDYGACGDPVTECVFKLTKQ